ncbi:MAG: hypothetical protein ACLTWR_02190 [Agathobaculum desmolans]
MAHLSDPISEIKRPVLAGSSEMAVFAAAQGLSPDPSLFRTAYAQNSFRHRFYQYNINSMPLFKRFVNKKPA